MSTQHETDVVRGIRSDYQYGFSNPDEAKDYFFKSGRGISHDVVEAIAEHKGEPEWMRAFRHKSLDYFFARPMPSWGADLSGIDFENIYYYIKPTEKQARIGKTFRRTSSTRGTSSVSPRRRRSTSQVSGPSTSQRSSTTSSRRTSKRRACSSSTWTRRSASTRTSSSSTWGRSSPRTTTSSRRSTRRSGRAAPSSTCRRASSIEMPLQAYFRINAENMGQFERTLIIVDEGAYVHYVEGCTAPIYSSDSLHSAVVEIIVKKRRPLPLHDDPELVEQRLQPGHQACRGLRGRDDGVGRRQSRVEGDDEVPGDLADGRGRPRRGALDRVRRQGPAPGRRRQGRARRPAHVLGDHLEVDLEGRRARRLPRAAARWRRARPARSRRSSATR